MQITMPSAEDLLRILETWFRDKGEWWSGAPDDTQTPTAEQHDNEAAPQPAIRTSVSRCSVFDSFP